MQAGAAPKISSHAVRDQEMVMEEGQSRSTTAIFYFVPLGAVGQAIEITLGTLNRRALGTNRYKPLEP